MLTFPWFLLLYDSPTSPSTLTLLFSCILFGGAQKMKCEQFLIVYDAAFVHGENFYAFFTVAEMEQYIKHQEYGNFDIVFNHSSRISLGHPPPPPPPPPPPAHPRRVTHSSQCPWLSCADRCSQSHVMPDSLDLGLMHVFRYLAWVAWEKRPKKKKKAAAGSADDLMGLDDEEEDSEDDEELPPPKERPLEWVSLGSEPEVLAGQCNPTRPPIKLLISRRRRYFGTPIRLADRVNDAVNEDGDNVCFGEWKAKEVDEEDPPPLHRKQLDNAAQAVIVTSASSAQTNWPRPRNVAISCQISTRGTEAEAGPAVPAGQPAAAGKPSRPPSAAGSKPSSAKKGSRPTTSASTGTGPDPAAVSPEEAAAAKLNSFLSTVMPTVRDALVENELLRLFDDDFVELAKHNGAATSTTLFWIFWTISRGLLLALHHPATRRVIHYTEPPCLLDPDWCLQSNVTSPNSLHRRVERAGRQDREQPEGVPVVQILWRRF